MSKIAQLQQEIIEQEISEYRELKGMDLEKRISDLNKEIEEKEDEVQYLQEGGVNDLSDIDILKEKIADLEKDLWRKNELLERYRELLTTYHDVD